MSEEIKQQNIKEQITEDLKELVIARLDVLPRDKKISIGSDGEEFTKEDLIDHVRKGSEIGHKVVNLELTFLRALKDGVLLNEILTYDDK